MSSVAASTWRPNSQVAFLRAGGEEAVAKLFSEFRDRLSRVVAFRLDPRLVGRIDPEDVLQEAYIEMARRISQFLANPAVSPFVWMRQITWQTLLTVHRRHFGQKRNVAQEIRFSAGASGQSTSCSLASFLAAQCTSPSLAAMRDERYHMLRDAIDRIDEVDREVLALRHFEQLGNSEVAEILGISKTAASNRYVRALRRLREYLDAGSLRPDELS